MAAHETSLSFPAQVAAMEPPGGIPGRQFGRYLIVGGLAFVADYGVLFLLAHLAAVHYLLSASAGFMVGLSVNYALCIVWVFDYRAVPDRGREFAIFALIGVTGLGINNGIIFAATEWAGLHYMVSKLVAAAGVLVFNFTLRRHFLFSKS